jgi:hypothetical protein
VLLWHKFRANTGIPSAFISSHIGSKSDAIAVTSGDLNAGNDVRLFPQEEDTCNKRCIGTLTQRHFVQPLLRACSLQWLGYGLINCSYSVVTTIPVAVRSKAWVFGRSLTGIVGTNPAGGMDVCVVFVVQGLVWNISDMKKDGRI